MLLLVFFSTIGRSAKLRTWPAAAWPWGYWSLRRITQDEYDKKARELKDRQAEVALRIEQHQDGEGTFRTTLESLISLASHAAELFDRSKIEQKRELVAFVFSNLQLRRKNLEYSMRSPFDLMVNRADYASWLGVPDSKYERMKQEPDLKSTLQDQRFRAFLQSHEIAHDRPDIVAPKMVGFGISVIVGLIAMALAAVKADHMELVRPLTAIDQRDFIVVCSLRPSRRARAAS